MKGKVKIRGETEKDKNEIKLKFSLLKRLSTFLSNYQNFNFLNCASNKILKSKICECLLLACKLIAIQIKTR